MLGCVNSDTYLFFDMIDIKEASDCIIYNGHDYILRHYLDMADILQIGILKRLRD